MPGPPAPAPLQPLEPRLLFAGEAAHAPKSFLGDLFSGIFFGSDDDDDPEKSGEFDPRVDLGTPTHNTRTTDRTPTFTWYVDDPDGPDEKVRYRFLLSRTEDVREDAYLRIDRDRGKKRYTLPQKHRLQRRPYWWVVAGIDEAGEVGYSQKRKLYVIHKGDDLADAGQFDKAKRVRLDSVSGKGQRKVLVERPRDTDLMKFTVDAGGRTTLRLTNVQPAFDGMLRVFDAAGNKIGQSNQANVGGDEKLVFDAEAGETYYALVRGKYKSYGKTTLKIDARVTQPVGRVFVAAFTFDDPEDRMAKLIDA